MAFSSLYCETSPKSAVGLLVVGGLAAAAVVAAVVVAGVLACELLLVLAATLTPCFFMSKTGVPPLYHYPQVIRLSPQYTACRFSKNYRFFFTYIFLEFLARSIYCMIVAQSVRCGGYVCALVPTQQLSSFLDE